MSTERLGIQRSRSDSINSSIYSVDEAEKTFQNVIKQLLQSTVFIGYYRERQYVPSIGDYRDLIEVSSNERKLQEALITVLDRINQHFILVKGMYWVGVLDPRRSNKKENNYCLYVEIPSTHFGLYWWQIKTVKFRPNEILLKVKMLREVSKDDLQANKCRSISNFRTEDGKPTENQSEPNVDWSIYFNNLFDDISKNLFIFVSEKVTLENTFKTLNFLFLLILTLVTGLIHSIPHICEYSLKFMREISRLVEAATPMFLGVLDFFSKIIGGLYILISMMWTSAMGPPRSSRQQLKQAYFQPRPQIRYK